MEKKSTLVSAKGKHKFYDICEKWNLHLYNYRLPEDDRMAFYIMYHHGPCGVLKADAEEVLQHISEITGEDYNFETVCGFFIREE